MLSRQFFSFFFESIQSYKTTPQPENKPYKLKNMPSQGFICSCRCWVPIYQENLKLIPDMGTIPGGLIWLPGILLFFFFSVPPLMAKSVLCFHRKILKLQEQVCLSCLDTLASITIPTWPPSRENILQQRSSDVPIFQKNDCVFWWELCLLPGSSCFWTRRQRKKSLFWMRQMCQLLGLNWVAATQ